MNEINEGTPINEMEFKPIKKRATKKIKKVEKKSSSPLKAGFIVIIIVVASLFTAWYFPRIGQPIFGWTENPVLTQQYYEEYVTDPTVNEYVVLIDNEINSTCSHMAVYNRPVGSFWMFWGIYASGYYDFSEEAFYFD